MQRNKSNRAGRRVLSFFLAFALMMTLLPASVTLAAQAGHDANEVNPGNIFEVRLSGFEANAPNTVRVINGTALWNQGHFRTQHDGAVINIAPPGRVQVFEDVTFSADANGDAVIRILVGTNAPIGSTFLIGRPAGLTIDITYDTFTVVQAPVTGDNAPQVAANEMTGTIVAHVGWEPPVVPEDLVFLVTNATAFPGFAQSGTLELGVTRFPLGTEVRVTDLSQQPPNASTVIFGTRQLPSFISTVPALPDALIFTPQGGGLFTGDFSWTGPIDISTTGAALPQIVDVTETNGVVWPEMPITSWFRTAFDVFETGVTGFPGVILRVTIVPEPEVIPESITILPGFVANELYFSNDIFIGIASQIWHVVGGGRVDGFNYDGIDYIVTFTDGSSMPRAAAIANNQLIINESLTILNSTQIELNVTISDVGTGTVVSANPPPIFTLNTSIRTNIIESAAFEQDATFSPGQTVSVVTENLFTPVVTMLDGLAPDVSFSTENFGVFNAENPATLLPPGHVLTAGNMYFIGAQFSSDNTPAAWHFSPLIVGDSIQFVLNTNVPNYVNGIMREGLLTVNVINGSVGTINIPAGAQIILTSPPVPPNVNPPSPITLTYNSNGAFVGTIPPDAEGSFTATDTNGFASGQDVPILAQFNWGVGVIRVDSKPPALAQVPNALALTVSVEDAFLSAANFSADMVTFNSQIPANFLPAPTVVDTISGITISWPLTINYSGTITVRDVANNTSQPLDVSFTPGVAPDIAGINLTPSTGWALEFGADVLVANTGDFTPNSLGLFWRVFDTHQGSNPLAWTYEALDAPGSDWNKITSGLLIPNGIDENGYLYVFVFGNPTTGGGRTTNWYYTSINNVIESKPPVFHNLNYDMGLGGRLGIEARETFGAFHFTVDAYAPNSAAGGPDNVRINTLSYAIVDEAVFNANLAGQSVADVGSWLTNNPGTVHAVTDGIITPAGTQSITQVGIEEILNGRIVVEANDSVVVVYAQNAAFDGTSCILMASNWTHSDVFDNIDDARVIFELISPAVLNDNNNDIWRNDDGGVEIIVEATSPAIAQVLWAYVPVGAAPPVLGVDNWQVATFADGDATFRFDTDGAFDIYVAATESLVTMMSAREVPFNTARFIGTIRYDGTAPSFEESNVVKQNQQAYSSVWLEFSATDAHSGLNEFRIASEIVFDAPGFDWLNISNSGIFALPPNLQGNRIEQMLTSVAAGPWLVVAIDNAGNVSNEVEFRIPHIPELTIDELSVERAGIDMPLVGNAQDNRISAGAQDIVVSWEVLSDAIKFTPGSNVFVSAFVELIGPAGVVPNVGGVLQGVNVGASTDGTHRVFSFDLNFANLGLAEGHYALVITAQDALGTPNGDVAYIFFFYVTTPFTVESLLFDVERDGIAAAGFAAFGDNWHPADNYVTVRDGDAIGITIEFNEMPQPNNGNGGFEMMVGGIPVELTHDSGYMFVGRLEVSLDTIETVLADAAWASSAVAESVPGHPYKWMDALAKNNAYIGISGMLEALVFEGFGYIKYELDFRSAAGNYIVVDGFNTSQGVRGTTGISISGIEPYVIFGSASVRLDPQDWDFWWNGVGFGYGAFIRDSMVFTFDTNEPITPILYPNTNLYGGQAIGTEVRLELTTESGDTFVFEVDLTQLINGNAGFLPGAASLVTTSESSPYTNILTIPLSMLRNRFEDSQGNYFDFDESANIVIHLELMTVSGVEQDVYFGSDELGITFAFKHVEAGVEVRSFDGGPNIMEGFGPAYVLGGSIVGAAEFFISGGTNNLIISDAVDQTGRQPNASSVLFHNIMNESETIAFLQNVTTPTLGADGWFGSIYANGGQFNRSVSPANDGYFLVIYSRSWTGLEEVFVVQLRAVADIDVSSNFVDGFVGVGNAMVTFSSMNTIEKIAIYRNSLIGPQPNYVVFTANLPTDGQSIAIVVDSMNIGTIQNNAENFVITITANGVYRLRAWTENGLPATAVFEVDR